MDGGLMLYNVPGLDDGKEAVSDDEIVKEAADNWQSVKEWQGESDDWAREDIKFANGDSRNHWQWPDSIYDKRTGENVDLPCLTINKTRTHNDIVINTMSKNSYSIKVRPVGGKASYKSAEVMNSLIRHIEDISAFSSQKRKVAEQQVDGGIGYILIETDFVSNRSFDQDIFLRAAQDPTGVYLDRWIREPDGSDAKFGFVFEKLPRKQFNRKYPKFKGKVGQNPIANAVGTEWLSDKEIMLAKYFRKRSRKDTLVGYVDAETGEEKIQYASEIKEDSGKDLFKALIADIKNGVIEGRTREISDDQVEWFLIAGDQIVDRGEWAGKYIPICRCVGRELVIDGRLDRKGHTRPLVDAQNMLNFSASTDVQMNALQPKAPWLAAARATEGQEQWKTANLDNFAVLTYNDIDDEALPELQKIDPPQRIQPSQGNPAYQTAMQNAERQMMMISGQFQAQMGENDQQSAASGKAINERQQQGDTATYHFFEHQSDMLRFIGKQLLDLIPRIYDTKRALHIRDEDGEKRWIQIDPSQQEAVRDLQDEGKDAEAAKLAFNPGVGDYECISDPGPDFATQRQEAWNAYSIILQQNMQLAAVIGDLMFKYGDFPGADKIAERLEKEIKATKPYLFDDEAEPQLVAAQQQMQRLTSLNAELIQKLALKDIALKGRDERRDIDAFKADTERMRAQIEALSKIMLTPQQKAQMEHELALAGHQHISSMIQQANQGEIDAHAAAQGGDSEGGSQQQPQAEQPPLAGARKAPDGKWYLKHPTTGQHFRVDRAGA